VFIPIDADAQKNSEYLSPLWLLSNTQNISIAGKEIICNLFWHVNWQKRSGTENNDF
jgi:hypothetical protein